LEGGQCRRYLYYLEFGALIDVRVYISDVVQYVKHQRPVPSPHFVYYQVMVGMVCEFVIRDHVSSDSFAIVGSEELGGCVP